MANRELCGAEGQATGTSDKPGPVIDAILDALTAENVRRVLDIGCGRGGLAAALVRRGYAVTGIDPQLAAINIARRRAPGAVFHCTGAERIPVADRSFGGVILLNSLHHIPGPLMRRALQEAWRVLRPSGVLVVVEPLAQGSFFEAMRPVDDETEVRAQALEALADIEADAGWTRVRDDVIDRVSRFADVEAFLEYLAEADPGRASAITACRAEVSAAFGSMCKTQDGVFVLRQPHLRCVLRKTG